MLRIGLIYPGNTVCVEGKVKGRMVVGRQETACGPRHEVVKETPYALRGHHGGVERQETALRATSWWF
jgi:hypothetical protein